MKNQTLLALFLALGISIAISQSVRADFYSAVPGGSSSSSNGQGDLAGDVNSLFYDPGAASDSADVHGFCTESPTQGSWQEDPRTFADHQEPYYDTVPVSFTLPHSHEPTYSTSLPLQRREDPSDTPEIIPEPATMLILGLGAAGLLPLSYRRRKQN